MNFRDTIIQILAERYRPHYRLMTGGYLIDILRDGLLICQVWAKEDCISVQFGWDLDVYSEYCTGVRKDISYFLYTDSDLFEKIDACLLSAGHAYPGSPRQ